MNIIKKILVFVFCFYANTSIAQSFKFKPTLNIFESYTYIKNYSVLNAGMFNMENSKFNFGVELTQKVYLDTLHFFKFGLRYQHFKKNINAMNQIPELYDYPYPFYWEYGYTAFSIPLHFGKNYYINNLNKGDFYFGLSLGILMTSYAKGGITQPQPKESTFTDPISYSILEGFDHNPNFFFPNIEVGFNYLPLKNFRKLSIGFNASIQLNKTGETKHIAMAQVPTKGYDFFYDFYNKNRVINFSVCVGYTF